MQKLHLYNTQLITIIVANVHGRRSSLNIRRPACSFAILYIKKYQNVFDRITTDVFISELMLVVRSFNYKP